MAVDKSDLMRLSKEELADGFQRISKRAKSWKEKAAARTEDFMQLAASGGAAFGVGYWLGNIKGGHAADGTDPTDDLKLFGLDKDLAVGLVATTIGLTGMGGKKMSGFAQSAGLGILSYWAGSAGERMAIERATEEEEAP